MSRTFRLTISYLVFLVLRLATPAHGQRTARENLNWLNPDDNRFRWLNVADWEQKTGGL